MPDTGAPHFIPFADPTDLVRDWPALSEDVADAVAAGLTAAGNAGIGSNVVQTVKTDTFTSTSTSFVTVTGLTATITPTTDTSRVLVVAQIATGNAGDSGSMYKITGGNSSVYVGDAEGTRVRGVFGGFYGNVLASVVLAQSIVFLDSPSTTSATTYQVEARGSASLPAVFVNRPGDGADGGNLLRGASSITLIEVAP